MHHSHICSQVEGKGLLKACMEGDWEAASVFLESGSYVGERDEVSPRSLCHMG